MLNSFAVFLMTVLLKNLVKLYDSKDLNLAISYKGFGHIFEILQLYKSREIVGATI